MSYVAVGAQPVGEAVTLENILVIDDESDWVCECEFMLPSSSITTCLAATG
jgi:hypothetical protein